jgi:ATP-binding cassette subfamily F protein uup
VTVNGESRHVHGYLRDFLFPAERARSPVKALSGGERNRLLLARLFTRPANVLVLDEPTNDLDLETLELLEAQLLDWPGTLLLVSHDRTFLDNIVTSTIGFEGNARVDEYVGGYTDWLRQRPSPLATPAPNGPATPRVPTTAAAAPPTTEKKRLSYHEQRELERLPAQIEALEAEQQALESRIASPDFYREPAKEIEPTLARLESVRAELTTVYTRWDELDSRSHAAR